MWIENLKCQNENFEYIDGNIGYNDDNSILLFAKKGEYIKFRVCDKNFTIFISKENLLQKLNINHGKVFVYLSSNTVAKRSFFTKSGVMLSNIDKLVNDEFVAIKKLGEKIVINNSKELVLSEENIDKIDGEFNLFKISKIINSALDINVNNHHEF